MAASAACSGLGDLGSLGCAGCTGCSGRSGQMSGVGAFASDYFTVPGIGDLGFSPSDNWQIPGTNYRLTGPESVFRNSVVKYAAIGIGALVAVSLLSGRR